MPLFHVWQITVLTERRKFQRDLQGTSEHIKNYWYTPSSDVRKRSHRITQPFSLLPKSIFQVSSYHDLELTLFHKRNTTVSRPLDPKPEVSNPVHPPEICTFFCFSLTASIFKNSVLEHSFPFPCIYNCLS